MSGIDSREWYAPSIEDIAPVDGPYPMPKPKKELTEEEIKRMWEAIREFGGG